MKLIIGLGNPGDKYLNTRHNVGFMALDSYVERNSLSKWALNDKFKALIIESGEGDEKLILAKPQTFMNLSGQSILAIKQFYKLDNSDITVIHDDVDIKFGEIRTKVGGGSAGHNGVKSIIGSIGEDFNRIRVGVRNPLTELVETSKFVLAPFTPNEISALDTVFSEIIESLD